MIERDETPFIVYASGHCDASCWDCDWTATFDSIAQAFNGWRIHRKAHA
jgi:hypothetical protein